MYKENDYQRIVTEEENSNKEYRSQFRRDYTRLLHSPSFRRLQGKTQLFPSNESDFFRNRLTHSLEVAQIAKAIGNIINEDYFSKSLDSKIDLDLLEFAGLAHDLGHPPFGHQGEEALDEMMVNHGGFEGNAQTLRILAKIEKKINIQKFDAEGNDSRAGLNLTYRSLASILKYQEIIPHTKIGRDEYIKNHSLHRIEPVKGYYFLESELVETIKKNVLGKYQLKSGEKFKTVECRIMDIADDIAYSTYDLEDGLKSGFYNPFDLIFSCADRHEKVAAEINRKLYPNEPSKQLDRDGVRDILFEIFQDYFSLANVSRDSKLDFNERHIVEMGVSYDLAKEMAANGYARVQFTSKLVDEFIRGVKFEPHPDVLALSEVYLEEKTKLKVEVLKKMNFQGQILSPKLRTAAFRGKKIVKEVFGILNDHESEGFRMMPEDYISLYEKFSDDESLRSRIVCDFISGMTDRYCISLYGRLTSKTPDTIFKPY